MLRSRINESSPPEEYWQFYKLLGLIRNSVDEVNELEESRLMQAAQRV